MSAEKILDTQTRPVASPPNNTAPVTENEKRQGIPSLAAGIESGLGDSVQASKSVTAGAVGAEARLNDPASSDDDGVEYPTGVKLMIVMVALCLVVLLVSLDNTIIATAIPRITDEFKALADVGWYGSAYLLTACAFQLMYGRLYSFFPIKWVFLAAITIFEVGSAVCGGAPNSTALIIGRAVAGMGSAGILSGALIIIAHSMPLEKRPIFSGILGSMVGVSSVAGPLMGGAFTDHVSWRWCFYINLPIGGATILVIAIFLQPLKQKFPSMKWRSRLRNLDPIGTAVFMPGVICLLLALQWGGSKYNWSNARIIVLLVLSVILMAAFVAIQFWQGDKATVPPRIVNQRSMIFGSLYAICNGGSFFLMMYYLPIWFQAIKGVSATKSGVMTIPMLLSVVLCSLISGAGITKMGYYVPFGLASGILAAIGAGLLTTFTPSTGHSKWIGYQVLYGAGAGLGYQLPMLIPQVVSALEDIPVAAVVLTFAQILGGAVFISVGQNIFSNRLVENIVQNVPSLDPSTVFKAGATQIQNVVPPELLEGIVLAYNNALRDTWYASVALSALSVLTCLGIEWRSVKGKKIGATVAA